MTLWLACEQPRRPADTKKRSPKARWHQRPRAGSLEPSRKQRCTCRPEKGFPLPLTAKRVSPKESRMELLKRKTANLTKMIPFLTRAWEMLPAKPQK